MVQSVASTDDLRTFLTEKAGVHVSYVDKVLELCDEQVAGWLASSLRDMRPAAMRAYACAHAGLPSPGPIRQMIGSVHNLQTASDLDMLGVLFKPVVAIGIQSALADVGGAGRPPSVAGAAAQLQQVHSADAPPQPQLAGALAYATPLAVAQRGLEVEPYWDMLPHLPMNTFKPKRPHVASISSVKRIVGADAPGEVPASGCP